MKHHETRMADLPYDMLRLITMLVAQSPDGAASFARAISSCKMLKEFAADQEILTRLEFENVRIFGIHESFWDENSLLCKCSDAGNERAYNIIRKQNKKEKLKRVMRTKIPVMAREFCESTLAADEKMEELLKWIGPAAPIFNPI